MLLDQHCLSKFRWNLVLLFLLFFTDPIQDYYLYTIDNSVTLDT